MMRKIGLILVGIFFLCIVNVYADSDSTKTGMPSLEYGIVITSNGVSETRIITYEACLRDRRWQTGEASKPFKGHLIDNREGHQELSTWVQRRFSVMTITGELADDQSFKQIYNVSQRSKGGWDNGGIIPGKWIGKSKPLYPDCGPEFNQNAQNAEAHLKAKFQEIVDHDLKNVLPNEIKERLPTATISAPAAR